MSKMADLDRLWLRLNRLIDLAERYNVTFSECKENGNQRGVALAWQSLDRLARGIRMDETRDVASVHGR